MPENSESNSLEHVNLSTIVKIDSQYEAEAFEGSDGTVYYDISVGCSGYNPFGDEPFPAVISLIEKSDDFDAIKELLQQGSYLWVSCNSFKIDFKNKYTVFNFPEIKPILESELDEKLIKHFDSLDNTSRISGHIEEIREVMTKSGARMAFIRLAEHTDNNIIVYAEQYEANKGCLQHGEHLEFLGVLETYEKQSDDGFRYGLNVKEINKLQ